MKIKLLPFEEARKKYLRALAIYKPMFLEHEKRAETICGIGKSCWESGKIIEVEEIEPMCEGIRLVTRKGEFMSFHYPFVCCEVVNENA